LASHEVHDPASTTGSAPAPTGSQAQARPRYDPPFTPAGLPWTTTIKGTGDPDHGRQGHDEYHAFASGSPKDPITDATMVFDGPMIADATNHRRPTSQLRRSET
jgi:hypothetical protein